MGLEFKTCFFFFFLPHSKKFVLIESFRKIQITFLWFGVILITFFHFSSKSPKKKKFTSFWVILNPGQPFFLNNNKYMKLFFNFFSLHGSNRLAHGHKLYEANRKKTRPSITLSLSSSSTVSRLDYSSSDGGKLSYLCVESLGFVKFLQVLWIPINC